MSETVSMLRTAQASRAASAPARAGAGSVRAVLLEPVRSRNLTVDAVFYDVRSLTQEEASELASSPSVGEGAILIVPPTGGGRLAICRTIDDFAATGGGQIRTITVAGVGSSAVGAAALARNVADATGAPVAAVVSGYGLADLATEALGGWFWFGSLNRVRHAFEVLDDMAGPRRAETRTAASLGAGLAEFSLDSRTVLALLADPAFSFDLLVGHSKGNLVLSEALYALEAVEPERVTELGRRSRIVTISARIAMPPAFMSVIDVMGSWDTLGELNSTPGIDTDISVPFALHHTNTECPRHINVTEVVWQALSM